MARLHPLDADLAASIARRRRAVGLSQAILALAAGLTEATLARYETMRYGIPADSRAALERALAEAEAKDPKGVRG